LLKTPEIVNVVGGELVVGAIDDPVGQDERPVVVAGGNLADPANGIALVADVAAIGVAGADRLPLSLR
jgi:hypothetical protein